MAKAAHAKTAAAKPAAEKSVTDATAQNLGAVINTPGYVATQVTVVLSCESRRVDCEERLKAFTQIADQMKGAPIPEGGAPVKFFFFDHNLRNIDALQDVCAEFPNSAGKLLCDVSYDGPVLVVFQADGKKSVSAILEDGDDIGAKLQQFHALGN